MTDTERESIQQALADLEDKHGRITPEAVVTAAQDPGSVLHSHFEWDDGQAAAAWRIEQARGLIRSVRVVITSEERTVSTIHYVRDPRVNSDEQGYVSLPHVRTDKDLARDVIEQEYGRALACMKRAEEVADALGVKPIVEKTRKQIAQSASRVKRVMEPGQSARA